MEFNPMECGKRRIGVWTPEPISGVHPTLPLTSCVVWSKLFHVSLVSSPVIPVRWASPTVLGFCEERFV